ncbi:MAG: transaldolase family protein [Thermomicrobiales bacterium]
MSAADIFEAWPWTTSATPAMCFRPIYDLSNGGDRFVSIEVAHDLARDSEGTREATRRLWKTIDRPNLMVKIPARSKARR